MKVKTPFGILTEKIEYIGKIIQKLGKPMGRKLWDMEEGKMRSHASILWNMYNTSLKAVHEHLRTYNLVVICVWIGGSVGTGLIRSRMEGRLIIFSLNTFWSLNPWTDHPF